MVSSETSANPLYAEGVVEKYTRIAKVTLVNGDWILVSMFFRPVPSYNMIPSLAMEVTVVANDGVTGLPLNVASVEPK